METIFAIPFPIMVIGADQQILGMNNCACAIFGANYQGRLYSNVIRQPLLLAAINEVFESGERREVPFIQSLAKQDVTHRAVCVYSENQSVVISFFDDSFQDEVEQLRSEFVANVSHELRSPLTALIGFIETMRGQEKIAPEIQAQFLGIMKRETDRMNRLIEDLLSLSRVEADERIRPAQTVEINTIISAAISICDGLTKQSKNEILFFPADIPKEAKLLADEDQLQQVFNNLIENAIKYGEAAGRIVVETQYLAHDPALRSAALSVCVTNQGEAIEMVHIPRLTERFYRVDEDRSRNTGGTGLGLAIVKHIVNRHRGRLKINSDPEQGNSFCIFLPLETEHDRF